MQKTRKKRLAGVTAIEFALVLPVLLLILFGIINFAIYLFDKAVITNASREGARAGIVAVVSGNGFSGEPCAAATNLTSGDSSAKCATQRYIADNLVSFGNPVSATISVASKDSTGASCADIPSQVGRNTCYVEVNVSYPFTGIGFVDFLLPAVQSRAVMYY